MKTTKILQLTSLLTMRNEKLFPGTGQGRPLWNHSYPTSYWNPRQKAREEVKLPLFTEDMTM
jgi:hypothetical protein